MLCSSKICFTFVNRTKNRLFCPKSYLEVKMKDRIRQIMESQHMTQQVFADFIGIAPATLSGIFTERTKPTINTIEAIKKKLPTLSTDWLMFGKEPMYTDQGAEEIVSGSRSGFFSATPVQESLFDSQQPVVGTVQTAPSTNAIQNGVKSTRMDLSFENMNNIDKPARKVTEIRVFYDDQTWESFVPAKK